MNRYDPEFFSTVKREPFSIEYIKQAIIDKTSLEALVTSCNKEHTLKLDLGKNIIGEITFENLEYRHDGSDSKVAAAVSKVGRRIKFIPLHIDNIDEYYIVQCSRKEIQRDCFENYIKKLKAGDIIPAKAIKAESYGIFCDIGCGIIALLPTSCVTTTHIVDPKKTLSKLSNMNLYVVVREIDNNYKIELTHKELLGTWEEEASKFSVGDVTIGEVLSIEEYGYFIRISQNLSGLAEINSELDIQLGDIVSVKINAILGINMKVKLNIVEKLKEEKINLEFRYKQTSGHIDKWVYSTEKSNKHIETVF